MLTKYQSLIVHSFTYKPRLCLTRGPSYFKGNQLLCVTLESPNTRQSLYKKI